MDAHASEDVSKHVRTYLMVFGALMVLTIITVGVSTLHLPTHEAILVALFIATIKGSLVALFFMHLNHERKLIYYVLALTVVFFVFVMLLPMSTNFDRILIK
jgi:cytochrome c oxidase subunit IV